MIWDHLRTACIQLNQIYRTMGYKSHEVCGRLINLRKSFIFRLTFLDQTTVWLGTTFVGMRGHQAEQGKLGQVGLVGQKLCCCGQPEDWSAWELWILGRKIIASWNQRWREVIFVSLDTKLNLDYHRSWAYCMKF